ncbi:MAG TPA: bifunctional ornithine acetyltransferase/N-acetylglutamate synthase, partial [Sphaerochaeta sp.]|nr:bifunctional ornithine acetyltransferase/N-acetylglutamate synthase [Sphaerochaeta sp.]
MKIIDGGITASLGFSAAGVYCGIKKRKKDLALVVSDRPCTFAGSFTTNVVKAAPVVWDQQIVASSPTVRSILVNSGNANACTAAQGDEDCKTMACLAAEALGITAEEVLVCSTGVIGVPMPMEPIREGVALASGVLAATREGASDAATAICTTDTFTKEVAVSLEIDGLPIHIGG